MIASETVRAAEAAPEAEAEVEGLKLSDGLRMGPAQCRPIRERTDTRVVSILAPKNAGKTSLVAAVYELFLEGRVSDITFAGSDTLFEFERIAHMSRAASGRTEADMERTQRALGLGYFHLLVRTTTGRRVALLLGDRPGETVHTAANGAAGAAVLEELRSADCVLYLMDGALFVKAETQNLPLSQAEAVLEGIVAAAHLGHRPPLAVVLTKADLVAEAGKSDRFESAFKALEAVFGDRFSEIRSFETAANPDLDERPVQRGHGMADLLRFMLTAERVPISIVCALEEPTRYFGRYGRGEESAQ